MLPITPESFSMGGGIYLNLDLDNPRDQSLYLNILSNHTLGDDENPRYTTKIRCGQPRRGKKRSTAEPKQDTSSQHPIRVLLVPRQSDVVAHNHRTVDRPPLGPAAAAKDVGAFYSDAKMINLDYHPLYKIDIEIKQPNRGEPPSVLPGLPPHKLYLKLGQMAMLIRNIAPELGLCSGTRVLIRRMSPKGLEVTILVGEFKGTHVCIPRIPLMAVQECDCDLVFERLQFPLKHIAVSTIARSQGESFDAVNVDLCKTPVNHRVFAVAMSRTQDPSDTQVIDADRCPQDTVHIKCSP